MPKYNNDSNLIKKYKNYDNYKYDYDYDEIEHHIYDEIDESFDIIIYLASGKKFVFHNTDLNLYSINSDIKIKLLDNLDLPKLDKKYKYEINFIEIGTNNHICLDFINRYISVTAVISVEIDEYYYSDDEQVEDDYDTFGRFSNYI